VRWGNCIVYAVLEYIREHFAYRRAGSPPGMEPRLVWRISRMAPAPVPTVAVGIPLDETGTRMQYRKFQPVDKRPLSWWQVWRTVWFRGHVVYGDDSPHEKE
jgi:hypothetical protein